MCAGSSTGGPQSWAIHRCCKTGRASDGQRFLEGNGQNYFGLLFARLSFEMPESDYYLDIRQCADRLVLYFCESYGDRWQVMQAIRNGAVAVVGNRQLAFVQRAAVLRLVRSGARLHPASISVELTRLGAREVRAAFRRLQHKT